MSILFAVLLAAQVSEPALSEPPSTTPAASKQKALRLAVTDIKVDGVEPRLAAAFNDALTTELRKLARTSVISTDEIRAMLDFEAQKQLVGCDASESCLAEIADSLGVDVLVTATLARVAGRDIVGLTRIDQKQAAVAGSANQSVAEGDGEAVLALIGPLVEEVFADVPVRAGQTRGVAPTFAKKLSPPPVPVWAFATTAVATGVVALTGVAATVTNAVLASQLDTKVNAAAADGVVIPGAALREEQQLVAATAWTSTGVLLGAVALAGVTATLAAFTDWNDDAAAYAEDTP